MNLTIPRNVRAPVIPLVALSGVVYANITNRCADGYCYTYGWPWVAYYGWTDAGFGLDGFPDYPRVEWLPMFGDVFVAAVILALAWAAHRRRERAAR